MIGPSCISCDAVLESMLGEKWTRRKRPFNNYVSLLKESSTSSRGKRSSLASSSNTMKISILSSDGLVFMVEELVAVRFPGIPSILDMLGNVRDDLRLPVRVNSWVLPKMINYFEKHTEEGLGAKALEEFDSNFADELEKDHSLLFGVLEAACSMEMDELIHLLCNKVATMSQGKSPDELCEMFPINNE